MKKDRLPKRGFTLLELMVAVVIVGLLGASSFAVISSARAKAHQVSCANNMRQIGIGLQAYADDHGHYPETTHSAGSLERAWVYELEEYMGDFDTIRVCPADPKKQERLEQEGTSYVLNSFVFVPKTDPFGRAMGRPLNRPQNLPDASRTLLAFCCSDHVPAGPGNDHTHSERWESWSAVTRDIAPDRHGDKRANYLFADGRVEAWTAAEVRSRIESGENIAKPPGT